MTQPTYQTTSGEAYLRLQRLALREGRPTQELFVHYVHERFLYRLAQSTYRDRLVLKGGMLLAAFAARRPTRDIDALALDLDNDEATTAKVITDIAVLRIEDGVTYDVDAVSSSVIREGHAYTGVRVSIPARVDRGQLVLRVDVNVGDPVTPGPVEISYPSLMGRPFRLLGYPVATVLAEKIVTLLERGQANTRERDVADILTLRGRVVSSPDLGHAIRATAAHRGTRLEPLGPVIGRLGELRQASWEQYLAKAGLIGVLPKSYSEALALVAVLANEIMHE